MRFLVVLLVSLAPLLLAVAGSIPPKITITDTGSTNTAGLEVTLDETGKASIKPQGEVARPMKLDRYASREFVKTVLSAGALRALPTRHCMKSASFGSSIFITYGSDRSPDLSCAAPTDGHAGSLRRQAEDILQAARKAAGLRTFRRPLEY